MDGPGDNQIPVLRHGDATRIADVPPVPQPRDFRGRRALGWSAWQSDGFPHQDLNGGVGLGVEVVSEGSYGEGGVAGPRGTVAVGRHAPVRPRIAVPPVARHPQEEERPRPQEDTVGAGVLGGSDHLLLVPVPADAIGFRGGTVEGGGVVTSRHHVARVFFDDRWLT